MQREVREDMDDDRNINYSRFQEIAGSLDSALLLPIQISHSDKGNSQHLTLNQSATLLECLVSCWREDVLVLSCSDKFLRLSLQLISRSVCVIDVAFSFC